MEAFMTFNSDKYDMKKYWLKWLRVLDFMIGLGFKSYVCHLCAV